MKYTNKWLLALLPAALLTSCAEDVFEPYNVEMPASIADVQYLNNYQVLKDYAGNFNIGAVVDAAKYANQGAVYGLATSNFFEISGGSSTMHAAMIRDNGSYNTLNFLDMVNVAKEANQKVFGSALLSNSNQNGKYFKNILADKIDPNYVPVKQEITKHDDSRCIKIAATALVEYGWDNQFWLVFSDNHAKNGDSWEYTMDVRADNVGDAGTASVGTQVHQKPSEYVHWNGIGNIDFTQEWQTVTKSGTIDDGGTGKEIWSIAFNLNDFAGANNYYFKNLSFKINGKEVLVNGDLKGTETSSFATKVDRGAVNPSEIIDGFDYTVFDFAPTEVEIQYNKPCIVVHSLDRVKENYETQFWIMLDKNSPINLGDSWEYTMKVRADHEAKASTQVHKDAGAYVHWNAIGDIPFTTDWAEVSGKGTFEEFYGSPAGGYSIALNLNETPAANTYYFASISFKVNGKEVVTNVDLKGSDNSSFVTKEAANGQIVPSTILPKTSWIITKDTPGIPLTEEEKHDTIVYALNNYIKGMMEAANGYVKSWDVISDVLSDDGSAIREASGDKDFNWSEILGEEDFARLAVKMARECGGNDLKLFINESGLENEAKLQGLKSWIDKWEADGVTKFDGISTTITASYCENVTELEATKAKIEATLKGLAETGRIIRIAGIDLTYKDEAGVDVATSAMTVEQGKKMGELYVFIIKKYKELIPDSQRYGLFISHITDDGDTPNGLWNAKYSRKPQYGVFAEGLQ